MSLCFESTDCRQETKWSNRRVLSPTVGSQAALRTNVVETSAATALSPQEYLFVICLGCFTARLAIFGYRIRSKDSVSMRTIDQS